MASARTIRAAPRAKSMAKGCVAIVEAAGITAIQAGVEQAVVEWDRGRG